jgi:hypothetical protein
MYFLREEDVKKLGANPNDVDRKEIIEKAVEINKFVSDANERELTKIVKRANGIGIAF